MKEFTNYIIDSDLYYLLLAYNDTKNHAPTNGRKISSLAKGEVIQLAEEALSYYKDRVKSIEEYLEKDSVKKFTNYN